MSVLERVGVIAEYEWRRAIAKKSVFALVILAAAIQTLVIVSNYEFNRSSGIGPLGINNSFMWIMSVLGGGSQALFIPLIAIIIAGGSMSEEYEHGTADILLSKPISRIEYLFGKLLGGFSL